MYRFLESCYKKSKITYTYFDSTTQGARMKIALLLVLLTVSHTVQAKRTLDSYIEKLCDKQCVNAQRLKRVVKAANSKYKLPRHLVLAVLKTESDFKRTAYNKGNYGLMQVNLTTHRRRFGSKNPYDIDANIDVGAEILSNCLKKYRSIKQTLTCYKGDESKTYQSEVLSTMLVLASLD